MGMINVLKLSTLSIVAVLIFTSSVKGQDIHYTLFDFAPLNFNPAETGNFYGTYRIHAIVRDQYAGVIGGFNEYKSPSLSADLPIIKGFRDQDWVGVGLTFYSDVAGTAGFKRNAVKLSAAYHLGLGKKGNTSVSLGYQTGGVQHKIKDYALLEFEDGIQNGSTMEDINSFEEDVSYTEHAGGVQLTSQLNEENKIHIGFSAAHFDQENLNLTVQAPDTSGGGGFEREKLQMRFAGQASYRTVLTDRVAVKPMVFFQTMGPASEFIVQGRAEYLLNAEKGIVLHGGLGMRVGESLQLMAGADIRDIRVMLAFDLATASPLSSASGGFSGLELAVRYIGKVYKKPEPDPTVFCPRF